MAERVLPTPGAQYKDREKIFGVRDDAKIKEVPLSEAQIKDLISKKKELMDKAYDLGYKYELINGNCPQATLEALKDTLGLEVLGIDQHQYDALFKSATGEGAGFGMSMLGGCGACIAGCRVISLITGREQRSGCMAIECRPAWRPCKHLVNKFLEKYGAISCKEIQRDCYKGRWYNLSDDNGEFIDFVEDMGFEQAGDIVGDAARWAVEIVIEMLEAGAKNRLKPGDSKYVQLWSDEL